MDTNRLFNGDDHLKSDLVHITLAEPPEILFYAVDVNLSDKVFKQGLNRSKSPFIEMYETEGEAYNAIPRNKIPSLFAIVSRAMAEDGYKFYHAETGEWLADEIPKRYIRLQ